LHELAVIKPSHLVAEPFYEGKRVRYKDDGGAPTAKFVEMFEAFALKGFVPNCDDFVNKKYLRGDMHSYGETESNIHSTRENLDRSVDEFPDVAEFDDFVNC